MVQAAQTRSAEVASGPRGRIKINGKRSGWCTNISINAGREYAETEVIDNIEVNSHEPVRYRVSGSISFIRIVNGDLVSQGLSPPRGKSAEEHLLNILNQADAVITVDDTVTGKTLKTVTGVKFTTEGFTMQAGAIVGEDIGFVGIREITEAEAGGQ